MKTLFCSQPFARREGDLQLGHLRRFQTRDAALRAGRVMRRYSAGVVVYITRGNPDADYWSEPEAIEVLGDVPPEAR